jgi:hypothetical protein
MSEENNIIETDGLTINTKFYPIIFKDETYQKLFAIQTVPDFKIWFKDKEISSVEMVQLLQRAE